MFIPRYFIFEAIKMELFSYILFQNAHCWCIEKLEIFVN
jgi:hypothetical protein